MMSGKENLIHNLQFSEIKSIDPGVKTTNNTIILIPYYFNYVLIASFLPIIGSVILLNLHFPPIMYLLTFLLIPIDLYFIVKQLNYYNKISIDLKQRVLIIQPNIICRLYKSKKLIKLSEVNSFSLTEIVFKLSEKRYIIALTDNNKVIYRLISTKKYETGSEIVSKLNGLH